MQSTYVTLGQRLAICLALIASLLVLTRSFYILGILSGVAFYYLCCGIRACARGTLPPRAQRDRPPNTLFFTLVLGIIAVSAGFLGVVMVSYLKGNPAYASIAMLIPAGLDWTASALGSGALSHGQQGTPAGG